MTWTGRTVGTWRRAIMPVVASSSEDLSDAHSTIARRLAALLLVASAAAGCSGFRRTSVIPRSSLAGRPPRRGPHRRHHGSGGERSEPERLRSPRHQASGRASTSKARTWGTSPIRTNSRSGGTTSARSTLPVRFNWAGVGAAVRSAVGYGDIPYTMRGQATIRTPWGDHVVPSRGGARAADPRDDVADPDDGSSLPPSHEDTRPSEHPSRSAIRSSGPSS